MEERLAAWNLAKNIVDGIVEKHGLEDRTCRLNPTALMSTMGIYTKAEQHLDHITSVANWLLGDV